MKFELARALLMDDEQTQVVLLWSYVMNEQERWGG
jgi:hypothetical protein